MKIDYKVYFLEKKRGAQIDLTKVTAECFYLRSKKKQNQ